MDGAILDNLLVDVAHNELHANVVIGIHLETSAFSQSDVTSVVSVFARAYAAGTAKNEDASKARADVLLDVRTETYSTADYAAAGKIIRAGYEAAAKQAATLEKYRLRDANWQSYLESRAARMHPAPVCCRPSGDGRDGGCACEGAAGPEQTARRAAGGKSAERRVAAGAGQREL